MADDGELNEPLFDASDAHWLSSRNELCPAGPNRLRISRHRFQNRSSDDDTEPSIASPTSSGTEDQIIDVPQFLHSEETYKILGFDDHTANVLFQKWKNMDRGVRDAFGDFFKMSQLWLDYRELDAAAPGDDWDRCLRALGIGNNLRRAILKPGFDEVRLTQSALQWVKFGMQMRWEALEDGYEASRERAQGLQLRGGGRSETPYTHKKAHGTMFEPRGDQPGDLILWKATGQTRMQHVFLRNPTMEQFDINILESQPPTDFSGRQSMNYFTPQLEAAQYYLRFHKDIADPQGVCLARIAVPNTIIEQAKPLILHYPSDIFKKTIWHSRNSRKPRMHVPELAGQRLFVGHASKGKEVIFGRMTDWNQVTEENLVKLGSGEYMTQYVFDDEGLGNEINETCQGKLRVLHGEKPEEDVSIFSGKA